MWVTLAWNGPCREQACFPVSSEPRNFFKMADGAAFIWPNLRPMLSRRLTKAQSIEGEYVGQGFCLPGKGLILNQTFSGLVELRRIVSRF